MHVPAAFTYFRKIFMKGLCLGIILWIFNGPVVVTPTKEAGDSPGNICLSKGGRFPPFSIHGQPPRRARGPDDLTMCRIFRSKTCCSRSQTDPVLVALRRLAGGGEASEECMGFWEALECAICDSTVGVVPGPPIVCASLCNRVYKSCGDAFFAADLSSQALSPCGPKDTICARGNELASNGTDFCQLAGFRVFDNLQDGRKELLLNRREEAEVPPRCFDGKPMAEYVSGQSGMHSERGRTEGAKKKGKGGYGGFKQRWKWPWGNVQSFGNVVTWAFGGLVLILMAGAALLRWPGLRGRRRSLAARMAAKNLQEARQKQQVEYARALLRLQKGEGAQQGGRRGADRTS